MFSKHDGEILIYIKAARLVRWSGASANRSAQVAQTSGHRHRWLAWRYDASCRLELHMIGCAVCASGDRSRCHAIALLVRKSRLLLAWEKWGCVHCAENAKMAVCWKYGDES